MGGLLHLYLPVDEQDKGPKYYALTGGKLSDRYLWECEGYDHPIQHLLLDKKDIEDKSKVDWLLKSLAVLQITWLILTPHLLVLETIGIRA